MSAATAPVPTDMAAMRVQNGALRTINAGLEQEIALHRAKATAYHVAEKTLDNEREANAILTAENERLREALQRANEQAEHFEREWFLRGDALEALWERVQHWFDGDEAEAIKVRTALARARCEA